ncbi:MAG: hypothetical protein RR058_05255 [Oscillospiraceae bacterium]
MKKYSSLMLGAGIFILAANIVVERFVVKIPNYLSIPLLIVAVLLVIAGGLTAKKKK